MQIFFKSSLKRTYQSEVNKETTTKKINLLSPWCYVLTSRSPGLGPPQHSPELLAGHIARMAEPLRPSHRPIAPLIYRTLRRGPHGGHGRWTLETAWHIATRPSSPQAYRAVVKTLTLGLTILALWVAEDPFNPQCRDPLVLKGAPP